MKRLTMLCVAAAALALPATAAANHMAGESYAGEFTTGLGGTVSFDVSGDGTLVDFDAVGFGEPGCESSLGRDDIPLTDHSFSFFDAGPPFISITGSFPTPGLAVGSAQLNSVCNSGSQSWRAAAGTVVDGMVQRSTDPRAELGNDVYNTTGANQTRSWTAKRGQARVFDVVLQNDGNEDGALSADGCGASRAFAVSYSHLGVDVTKQVVNGTFSRNVIAGGLTDVRLRIKPKASAKVGQVKTCAVREESALNADVVKAKLKVKRG